MDTDWIPRAHFVGKHPRLPPVAVATISGLLVAVPLLLWVIPALCARTRSAGARRQFAGGE